MQVVENPMLLRNSIQIMFLTVDLNFWFAYGKFCRRIALNSKNRFPKIFKTPKRTPTLPRKKEARPLPENFLGHAFDLDTTLRYYI